MLSSSSTFVASTVAIYHNAIKSLIFSAAQILMAMAVFAFLSLIAAKAKVFSAYLMFFEDLIQKSYFIASRGISGSSILVLCFVLLYTAANLYGTLLWGFDAPGYVMQGKNVSASTLQNSMLANPDYILYLDVKANNLANLDQEMPHMIGTNLFKTGSNFTLTPNVNRGRAEFVTPARTEVGGRIWLDGDGLSVSPDTQVMVSYKTDQDGKSIPMDCPVQELGTGVAEFWNCTVNNTYVQPLLTTVVGQPEVHWDIPSDKVYDSRYIKPDRRRNIWAAFGQGGGTALMKQMFTVTKGTRRHTFIETTFRATIFTIPSVPFSDFELMDILKRTWSTNATEQQAPILTRLSNSIKRAQDSQHSFLFGTNDADNVTTTQVTWEYLTPEFEGDPIYSLLRISVTNITVVRSEDIAVAPTPFAPCDTSYMNIAYGGVVSDTDCAVATQGRPKQFFGQVDTSAVLILNGLGDGKSNISGIALDQRVYEWAAENSQRMDELLMARGYIVSIDPSLVTVQMSILKPAISYLQMFLVLLALVLYVIAWLSLKFSASSHWSSSLLLNLLSPMNPNNRGPGYVYPVPNIRLQKTEMGSFIIVNDSALRLNADSLGGVSAEGHAVPQYHPFPQQQPVVQYEQVPQQPKDTFVVEERQSYLPQYQQPLYPPKG